MAATVSNSIGMPPYTTVETLYRRAQSFVAYCGDVVSCGDPVTARFEGVRSYLPLGLSSVCPLILIMKGEFSPLKFGVLHEILVPALPKFDGKDVRVTIQEFNLGALPHSALDMPTLSLSDVYHVLRTEARTHLIQQK